LVVNGGGVLAPHLGSLGSLGLGMFALKLFNLNFSDAIVSATVPVTPIGRVA
jgi:hypothetical protein